MLHLWISGQKLQIVVMALSQITKPRNLTTWKCQRVESFCDLFKGVFISKGVVIASLRAICGTQKVFMFLSKPFNQLITINNYTIHYRLNQSNYATSGKKCNIWNFWSRAPMTYAQRSYQQGTDLTAGGSWGTGRRTPGSGASRGPGGPSSRSWAWLCWARRHSGSA